MKYLLLSLAVFSSFLSASAAVGEPCNPSANHLDPSTHKFVSDCGPTAWCSPTDSTCAPKGCRIHEFPFGYGPNDVLPPQCPEGFACPDEESACEALVPVGGTCQLNRDDECAPNPILVAASNVSNSAICLQYTCHYPDIALGQTCFIDNTVYTGFLPSGALSSDVVSRDNCSPNLFCDATSLTCQATLPIGSSCTANTQCASYNCGSSDTCTMAPETPVAVGTGVYIGVAIGIAITMVGIVMGLFKIHKAGRRRRDAVLNAYWTEQLAFRKSIMDLHSTAAAIHRGEQVGHLDGWEQRKDFGYKH